jgi:hypothetical protein
MKELQANNFVQVTPVFAILLVVSHVPGAPDDNRWAAESAILRMYAKEDFQ